MVLSLDCQPDFHAFDSNAHLLLQHRHPDLIVMPRPFPAHLCSYCGLLTIWVKERGYRSVYIHAKHWARHQCYVDGWMTIWLQNSQMDVCVFSPSEIHQLPPLRYSGMSPIACFLQLVKPEGSRWICDILGYILRHTVRVQGLGTGGLTRLWAKVSNVGWNLFLLSLCLY